MCYWCRELPRDRQSRAGMRAEAMSVVEDVVAGEEIDESKQSARRESGRRPVTVTGKSRHAQSHCYRSSTRSSLSPSLRQSCAHRRTVHNPLVWTRQYYI